MNTYVVFSKREQEQYRGQTIKGQRCNCERHYFYRIPLSELDLEAIARAPWEGRGGRKHVLNNFWVSNSSCYVKNENDQRLYARIDRMSGIVPPADESDSDANRFDVLDQEQRSFLLQEMERFRQQMASSSQVARLARYFLDVLLWCWTADGTCVETGQAQRDALKYSFDHLWHSQEAHRQYETSGSVKGLRHEHAVPRAVLIEHFRKHPVEHAVLEQYCFGAIITRAEDARLTQARVRAKMPAGFDPPKTSRFARYDLINLELQPPRTCTCLEQGDPDPILDDI